MTKKRIIRAAALLLFIAICTGMVWAQDSYWEGKVSTAPYGLLPHSGNYAASNAFPLDSKVEITHPSNGTTVEVRIVERVNTDRIFMQVSREAAQELGISEDEILTAKVSPLQSDSDTLEPMISQDKPYTADPDLNPSAAVDEDGLSVVEQYLADREQQEAAEAPKEAPSEPPLEPEGETTVAVQPLPEEQPPQEPTVEPEAAQPEAAQPEAAQPEAVEPTKKAGAVSPEADILPDASQPRSQISVELPEPSLEPERMAEAAPSEDEVPAAEKADATAEVSEPRGPEVAQLEPMFIQQKDRRYSPAAPQLPAQDDQREGPTPSLASADPDGDGEEELDIRVSHSPEPPKADTPAADIAAAEEPASEKEATDKISHAPVLPVDREAEEKIAGEPAETPSEEPSEPGSEKEIPEDSELVLVPAEERPPEGPATVTEERPAPAEKTVERSTRPSGGTIPVQRSIDTGSYYLQVAAYSKLDLARSRGQELAAQYPVTLYEEESNTAAPYKLMIGPLNEHESGTLLFTFTSRGYRDAFIRKGN